MRQESFSMTGYFDKGKKTKRERFLGEMEQVLPWVRPLALIEPYYPKGSSAGGRPPLPLPLPLERMFRIYCLQRWYNLSDPVAEAPTLEVRMDDRPGVVHLVCAALAARDISVRSAHVSTVGPQAVDVFYLQEQGAGRLSDERAAEAAHAVRGALLGTVSEQGA